MRRKKNDTLGTVMLIAIIIMLIIMAIWESKAVGNEQDYTSEAQAQAQINKSSKGVK